LGRWGRGEMRIRVVCLTWGFLLCVRQLYDHARRLHGCQLQRHNIAGTETSKASEYGDAALRQRSSTRFSLHRWMSRGGAVSPHTMRAGLDAMESELRTPSPAFASLMKEWNKWQEQAMVRRGDALPVCVEVSPHSHPCGPIIRSAPAVWRHHASTTHCMPSILVGGHSPVAAWVASMLSSRRPATTTGSADAPGTSSSSSSSSSSCSSCSSSSAAAISTSPPSVWLSKYCEVHPNSNVSTAHRVCQLFEEVTRHGMAAVARGMEGAAALLPDGHTRTSPSPSWALHVPDLLWVTHPKCSVSAGSARAANAHPDVWLGEALRLAMVRCCDVVLACRSGCLHHVRRLVFAPYVQFPMPVRTVLLLQDPFLRAWSEFWHMECSDNRQEYEPCSNQFSAFVDASMRHFTSCLHASSLHACVFDAPSSPHGAVVMRGMYVCLVSTKRGVPCLCAHSLIAACRNGVHRSLWCVAPCPRTR